MKQHTHLDIHESQRSNTSAQALGQQAAPDRPVSEGDEFPRTGNVGKPFQAEETAVCGAAGAQSNTSIADAFPGHISLLLAFLICLSCIYSGKE